MKLFLLQSLIQCALLNFFFLFFVLFVCIEYFSVFYLRVCVFFNKRILFLCFVQHLIIFLCVFIFRICQNFFGICQNFMVICQIVDVICQNLKLKKTNKITKTIKKTIIFINFFTFRIRSIYSKKDKYKCIFWCIIFWFLILKVENCYNSITIINCFGFCQSHKLKTFQKKKKLHFNTGN